MPRDAGPYIYIYLEPLSSPNSHPNSSSSRYLYYVTRTQMGPLVLLGMKRPCFGGGSPAKIEVSWVLGM